MTDERGTATVVAVSLASVLVLVTSAVGWVIGLVSDHRAAQSAADLAALAGAGALQHAKPPCAAAAEVAQANGATLADCRAAGRDVWVTVRVVSVSLGGLAPDVTGRAHAGPGP